VDAFSAIKEGKELNMDDQNALNSIIQITMKEVITSNGIPFGSPTDKYQGLSDGNNGVQWNVGIEKTTCTIRFGINLESKAPNNRFKPIKLCHGLCCSLCSLTHKPRHIRFNGSQVKRMLDLLRS
jgi:hypothetical protein